MRSGRPATALVYLALGVAGCASGARAYPGDAIAGRYSCCFESGFLRACADGRLSSTHYYLVPSPQFHRRYEALRELAQRYPRAGFLMRMLASA